MNHYVQHHSNRSRYCDRVNIKVCVHMSTGYSKCAVLWSGFGSRNHLHQWAFEVGRSLCKENQEVNLYRGHPTSSSPPREGQTAPSIKSVCLICNFISPHCFRTELIFKTGRQGDHFSGFERKWFFHWQTFTFQIHWVIFLSLYSHLGQRAQKVSDRKRSRDFLLLPPSVAR